MIERFSYYMLRGRFVILVGLLLAVVSVVLSMTVARDSLRSLLIDIWFIVAFLCTFISIYWQRKSKIYGRLWPFFAIVLGISNGFLVGLAVRTLFLITNSFNGSVTLAAPVITALIGGAFLYLFVRAVDKINQSRFLSYIAATYVVGVVFATINTRVFSWWFSSICTLGMPWRQNSDIYNSTLIVVGLLMALFVAYVIPQFKALLRKKIISLPKIITISSIYSLEIIGIMSVGMFPYGVNDFVSGAHIFFGAFVFYDMGALMLLSVWLFSGFPKRFQIVNYLLLIAGILLYSVSFVLCFNLKVKWLAFPFAEFVTAAIIIAWFLMVLGNIKRLSRLE